MIADMGKKLPGCSGDRIQMLGIELGNFFAPFPLSRFSFARYARCRTPERFIGRAFIAHILLARLRRHF